MDRDSHIACSTHQIFDQHEITKVDSNIHPPTCIQKPSYLSPSLPLSPALSLSHTLTLRYTSLTIAATKKHPKAFQHQHPQSAHHPSQSSINFLLLGIPTPKEGFMRPRPTPTASVLISHQLHFLFPDCYIHSTIINTTAISQVKISFIGTFFLAWDAILFFPFW